MTTAERRSDIYETCFDNLGLHEEELARLVNLGGDSNWSTVLKIQGKLDRKAGRGVTKVEALALMLLLRLSNSGEDLKSLVFGENGWIEGTPGYRVRSSKTHITKEDRANIYVKCFEELGITQAELSRLVNLGESVTQSVRNKVNDKLARRTGRGVTKIEALALMLLLKLKHTGEDLSAITFDEHGWIKGLTASRSISQMRSEELSST